MEKSEQCDLGLAYLQFLSFKVMEQVRLALINPSYLDDVKESLEVVESQACERLISEDKNHRPRWSTTDGGMCFFF